MPGYLFAVLPKDRQYFNINLALAFIIGGAIGNLIDRIRLNYVVDFFDFRVIGFAIFNVADSFVVIGCIIMVIAIWQNRFPQKKEDFRPILPSAAQRTRQSADQASPAPAAQKKKAPAAAKPAARPAASTSKPTGKAPAQPAQVRQTARTGTAPTRSTSADPREPVRFSPSKPMEAPKASKPRKDPLS